MDVEGVGVSLSRLGEALEEVEVLVLVEETPGVVVEEDEYSESS